MTLQSKWTVRYQIATYSGEIEVYTDLNADQETAISKARQQLKRKAGEFPFGIQTFTVVDRTEVG